MDPLTIQKLEQELEVVLESLAQACFMLTLGNWDSHRRQKVIDRVAQAGTKLRAVKAKLAEVKDEST